MSTQADSPKTIEYKLEYQLGKAEASPKDQSIEQQQLELERYKTKMDFLKFVWGSVVAAIAVAAIPPLFQLATAVLQNARSDAELRSKEQTFRAELQVKQQASTAELLSKQQAFRDEYVKAFVANALDQDIELRIRLAQYFARVTTDAFREGWVGYRDDLVSHRNDLQDKIDKVEAELKRKTEEQPQDVLTVQQLERKLRWMNKEVGNAERNLARSDNGKDKADLEGGLGK
jgi:hypothetical protein